MKNYILIFFIFSLISYVNAQDCKNLFKLAKGKKEVIFLINTHSFLFGSDTFDLGFSFLKKNKELPKMIIYVACKGFQNDIWHYSECKFFFENGESFYLKYDENFLDELFFDYDNRYKNTFFIDFDKDQYHTEDIFRNLKSNFLEKIEIKTFQNSYSFPLIDKEKKIQLKQLANCITTINID